MLLPSESLTPILAFLVMTLGSWFILSWIATRPRVGDDRLRRLIDPAAARGASESAQLKRQEALQAKVVSAASKIGKSLRPTDEEEIGKLRLRLLRAGFRSEQAVAIYYGLKVLLGLLALALAVPPLVVQFGFEQSTYVLGAAAGAVGFYAVDFIINRRIKQRAESIFMTLPDALDLMVVCVEAGLGLDAAMRRVTTELGQSSPVLCEEIAIANFQIQMGRPRKDVLRDLGTRTGVDDVRALAAVIIQAEKFGSSIAAALRVQSDAMRLRRRQLAEERAAQTSVKIMLPLIFFIFPGVFVVLVGPAAIQLAATLGK
jgi:tight adherence protein C